MFWSAERKEKRSQELYLPERIVMGFVGILIFCGAFLPVPIPAADDGASPRQLITEDDSILIVSSAFPESGEVYGWLYHDETGLSVLTYWGDSEEILNIGAGTCAAGHLPGSGKTVILAGHVLSYFQRLQYLEPGDILHFDTWYGAYEYQVTQTCVYDQFDLQNVIDVKLGFCPDTESLPVIYLDESEAAEAEEKEEKEELILYTCYPFYKMAAEKTDRFTVFAEKISGPDVQWVPESGQIYYTDEEG